MANYVEYIKVGSGESWPVRDADAHAQLGTVTTKLDTVDQSLTDLSESVTEMSSTMDSTVLKTTGGTMTGDIAMSGMKVTGLGAPTEDTDATTKAYVDSKFAAATPTSSKGVIVSVTAYTPIEFSLENGEAVQFTYCTSHTSSNENVTMIVNDTDPHGAGYTFAQQGNFVSGYLTYTGSAYFADFSGIARLCNGRLHVTGIGLRGNGTGAGYAALVWTDIDYVESIAFSHSGTLSYTKL